MTSRQKALLVADLAREKKADNTVILDMRKVANITDFFIIASATSSRRAQAISENIKDGLLKAKQKPSSIEGYQEGKWILIDAHDVVAHIFTNELRSFYNLEGLWGDAPRIKPCRKNQKKTRKSSKKASKRN